ncbi:Kinase family protein [Melia azedarach]|uniref:Kinase family protein n=1 Tax=Melia azedarach TaxID=155640 RepID=A0ACC1XFA8_MELAZ|nr:Kinase family protein [Melia azedarach]
MTCHSYLVFFLIPHLLLLSLAKEEKWSNPSCSFFPCGNLGLLHFPFANRTNPECGLMIVDDCNKAVQKIQLGKDGPWYNITNIAQDDSITLQDPVFRSHVHKNCESIKNLTLPSYPFLSFEIPFNLTLIKCPRKLRNKPANFSLPCNDSVFYYNLPKDNLTSLPPPQCSLIQLPVHKTKNATDLIELLTGSFLLQVLILPDCWQCNWNGSRCEIDSKGKYYCGKTRECGDCHRREGKCVRESRGKLYCSQTGNKNKKLKLGLGIGGGVGFFLIGLLCVWFICRQKKQKYASRNIHSGNTSSLTPSKSDLETGTVYFGVPIFSYSDLADATNNFNHEKELGDGGFGTVYYGKLRDGREVAVKRLYEHNYRRVEQFMNEIEILTRLRHKNLVSLYGCTSRHSQGLLLVYEFVPNGTVADHLHGGRAKPCLLSWPIRMNIAIETASALAYLHASDIIHRDVKTNNILLDNNFGVKVADFGLSRLFPTDVTHISTAPQGTPGYVDPEYHQCYQLTDKSDVYSFGVVLIELISSMPAVDITRHRHEINLANLAMNKIQKCAFDELIDPCLGYHSDEEVKRMTTSVAELAFLCLQQNKEMRPSMDEVLEELERIQSGEPQFENQKEKQDNVETFNSKQKPPPSPCCDEVSLLKNMRLPSSPISVTEKWVKIFYVNSI